MKNLKENFKKHWKISLIICVLICVLGAGLWLAGSFMTKDVASETYVVEVTDANGKSVEEVYLVLCAEDGTELSWLPYVTNMSGKAQFSEGIEEGCYVKVVGVPFGYKLDESVKYNFDEEGKVKIVLTEDDSVYVAKIGDTVYGSLASALGVANASSDDVVIELLADTSLKTFTIKNNYGKNITIKGNGHTITAEGGNNTFVINSESGEISFEDMIIKQKNYGAAIQVNSLVTVNLTDVELDATEGNEYRYALINTLAVDGTTTLNLTRVNAKMAVGSAAKADEAGIIRTGNTSGTKTVNINMVDCNFDTTGATGRHGIVVMKNTVANIDIKNSIIKAGDAYAIWAVEQTKEQSLITSNSQFLAETSPYSASPIKGYAARIGNTYYLTLDHAAKAASTSKKDVTITVVADVTMKTCNINNTNGATITVDGNGKTITTEKGNNAFVVGNNVALKNMTINHKNTGSAIHVTTAGTVKATDVFIKATEGEEYTYTLINILAEGETRLDFTRVKVTMAVETEGKSNPSIIRTGNSGVEKTIVMNLTDCNLDTTKATGRSGITVTADATTTVNLKNTTIKTMDTFAIRSNEQDINWNNADTTLTSLKEEYQIYPVEGYLAKIGDVFYTFKQAVNVANAAKADTEIKMLADYSITSSTINNKEGKLITLDGNGYKITSKGGKNNNAFVVGNNITFENMTIVHKNYGSAVQITEAGNVSLANVTIDATSPSNVYEKKDKDGNVVETFKNTYTYALINVMATGETNLDLSDVTATMAVAGMGQAEGYSAIIRTGNNTSKTTNNDKTVNMNLVNCNFDTTQATDRNGIVVMKGTKADIKLTNTSIKTLDVAAIQNYDTTYPGTATADDNILTVKAKGYAGEKVEGYKLRVGNTWYTQCEDIFEAAKTATEDVTIILDKDYTYDLSTLVNESGKTITVDTNGKTLTATKDNENVEVICEAKIAVGTDTLYTTFTKALAQANAASAASTIELMSDITVNEVKVNKELTINGNGKTVTTAVTATSTPKHAFRIYEAGKVVFNDVTINHTKVGNAIQINNAAEVTLNKVKLNSTETDNEYALINVLGTGTSTIVLSEVEVVMSATDKGADDNAAIIRTGNAGAKNKKTVNITITNSSFDTTKATGRNGIAVMDTTTANITLDDKTNIKTLDAAPIKLNSLEDGTSPIQTITLNGATLDSVVETYKESPISGYEAKIGDKYYPTFAKALTSAKANDTVELLQDVVAEDNAKKADGTDQVYAYVLTKAITVNGNGNKVTSEADVNNLFRTTANVTLKDMTIVHKGSGAAVQVNSISALTMEDMAIDATEPGNAGYKYALINITAKNTDTNTSPITLNLTNVDIDMDVTTPGAQDAQGWSTIIRTGNENDEKTVNINLDGCELDATDALRRHGILVMKKTKATIELTDTKIKTKDVSAIKTCNEAEGQATITNGSSLVAGNGAKAIEGYNYKVDDTWYVGKPDSTPITLTADTTMNLSDKENLTINTNGYCLTTTGSGTNVTINSEATMSTAEGTLYLTLQEALERAESATEDVVITVTSDCTVDVTNIGNVNGHTITVNTGDYDVTVKGNLGQNVVIGDVWTTVSEDKVYMSIAKALASTDTIEVNMYRNLTADLSADAVAAVTVSTNGYQLTTGALGNNVSVDSEASVPTGINTAYVTLKDAMAVASTSTSDVTVTVRKELTANEGYAIGSLTRLAVTNKITIDGGNYAITPTEGMSALFTVNHAGDVEFKNVKINAGDVAGCGGILITKGGKITLDNPTITTKDTLGVDNQDEDALVKRTGGSIVCNDVKVKLNGEKLNGETPYNFATAVSAANSVPAEATAPVIEIWSDIEETTSTGNTILPSKDGSNFKYCLIKNTNKAITIDGNSCALTVEKGANAKNALKVQGETTFKDLVLNYDGQQALIQVGAQVDVSLVNVDINASTTGTTNLQYAVINLSAKGTTEYVLKLKNSNIVVQDDGRSHTSTYSGHDVIKTGNKNDAKTVKIILENTKIDATKSKGRNGIHVFNKTNATIELWNTTILTDASNVITNSGTTVVVDKAATDATYTRSLILKGSTQLTTQDTDNVVYEQMDAITYTDCTVDASELVTNTSQVSTLSLEEEEQTTKTITLEVPIDLYEKLVTWIKQFEFFDKLKVQW